MAALVKFNIFALDLSNKVHNFGSDQFAIMLTNTLPVVTNTVKANITDLSTANGYTAGGTNATTTSNTQTSGVEKFILATVSITASGGNIGPFEYVVLFNKTTASGNLIGWYDYGTALTITNGNTFSVQFDPTNGVFTIT